MLQDVCSLYDLYVIPISYIKFGDLITKMRKSLSHSWINLSPLLTIPQLDGSSYQQITNPHLYYLTYRLALHLSIPKLDNPPPR